MSKWASVDEEAEAVVVVTDPAEQGKGAETVEAAQGVDKAAAAAAEATGAFATAVAIESAHPIGDITDAVGAPPIPPAAAAEAEVTAGVARAAVVAWEGDAAPGDEGGWLAGWRTAGASDEGVRGEATTTVAANRGFAVFVFTS